jgi:endo-1,4-beta-xylanase
MRRTGPASVSRRAVLLGGAAALGTATALPTAPVCAGGAAGSRGLAARAALKGLLFGASFATHELDKPYGPGYAELYKSEARILTSELELKLSTLRPSADRLDFAPADRLVAFARESGHVLHGHTLIWNDALPAWVGRLDTVEREQLLETHIFSVLERYRHGIPTWDVVNEPIAPWDHLPGNLRGGAFYDALGDGYIAKSFSLARAAAPNARLFLNEAQTESDDENGRVFRESLKALLQRLKDEGVPVDGVGLECHLDTRRPYDFPRFADFVAQLGEMGFDLAISELDVNDAGLSDDPNERDAQVADIYGRFLKAVLAVKAVRRLTLWQMADHTSWLYYEDLDHHPRVRRRPRPLPFDAKFQRKRAWHAIARALDDMPARPEAG